LTYDNGHFPHRYDGQESSSASREYNAKLRLQTMRHAMVGVMSSPPAGFEEVVAAHFAARRDCVLATCRGWVMEATEEERPRMVSALTALHAALPPQPPRPAGETAGGATEGGVGGQHEGGGASASAESAETAAESDEDFYS